MGIAERAKYEGILRLKTATEILDAHKAYSIYHYSNAICALHKL